MLKWWKLNRGHQEEGTRGWEESVDACKKNEMDGTVNTKFKITSKSTSPCQFSDSPSLSPMAASHDGFTVDLHPHISLVFATPIWFPSIIKTHFSNHVESFWKTFKSPPSPPLKSQNTLCPKQRDPPTRNGSSNTLMKTQPNPAPQMPNYGITCTAITGRLGVRGRGVCTYLSQSDCTWVVSRVYEWSKKFGVWGRGEVVAGVYSVMVQCDEMAETFRGENFFEVELFEDVLWFNLNMSDGLILDSQIVLSEIWGGNRASYLFSRDE